jgi:hypothetical protein
MACENDKCEKYGLHHDFQNGVEIRKCQACEREEQVQKGGIMSEWISVEDRLPDLTKNQDNGKIERPSECVLVRLKEDNEMYVAYYNIFKNWNVSQNGCGCCSEYIHPTHWMPLPKPPEEIK